MRESITSHPIELPEGKPRHPALYDAVQEFCFEELGCKYDFSRLIRSWCVMEEQSNKVLAVGGVLNVVDCPIFHVARPADRKSLANALCARDMLLARMRGNLEDNGLKGAPVMIHVAENSVDDWKNFLRRLGAVPANRYCLTI